MTVAGDTRLAGRNPQKAMVAMTASIWAASMLSALPGSTAAVSLPGGFLAAHMQETLPFSRRIFYELDSAQVKDIREKMAKLQGWSYTDRELQRTAIVQGNIFHDEEAITADHSYHDWDITGTIKEAEKYGLADGIRKAALSHGHRALALTVSVRRAGTEYTIKRWKKLVKDAVKDQPNRVATFEPVIKYGGIYRGTAVMVLLRAMIKPGGKAYDERAGKLSRMRKRTVDRIYREMTGQTRGRLPKREVMVARILHSEFPPIPPTPPVISFDRADLERRQTRTLKRHYRAHVQPRGRWPSRETMIARLSAL